MAARLVLQPLQDCAVLRGLGGPGAKQRHQLVGCPHWAAAQLEDRSILEPARILGNREDRKMVKNGEKCMSKRSDARGRVCRRTVGVRGRLHCVVQCSEIDQEDGGEGG